MNTNDKTVGPVSDEDYLDLFHSGARGIDTSAIRAVFQLAAQLKNPINLSIGQPHFPTPEPVVEAVARAVRDGKTAYTLTQGIPELREAYAQKIARRNGFNINPDQLLVTSGVASCLQLIFMSMIAKGDRVLIIEPYFLMYRSLLEFFGARVDYLPEDFSADDLKSSKESYKFIVFSNPSNPTGYVLKADQLNALADFAERAGSIVISDEIYELFDYDGDYKSFASIYKNTLSLFGFSKSYSMTGLRLAVLAGPKPIISKLTTIQQYTIVCAPSIVQYGGLAALETDMKPYVDDYRNKRDYVLSRLNTPTFSQAVTFHKPSGAFYFFFYLKPELDGTEFVKRAIEEKELLLVPGHIFTRKKNSFRLSYATGDETLARGLDALASVIDSQKS